MVETGSLDGPEVMILLMEEIAPVDVGNTVVFRTIQAFAVVLPSTVFQCPLRTFCVFLSPKSDFGKMSSILFID